MKIELKGLDDLRAILPAVQRELPYATSRALNTVAYKARVYEIQAMPTYIHRPVYFTRQAVLYERGTKETLKSRVYLQDTQANYLQWSIFGGTRTPESGKALGIPWQAPLNVYGNMPNDYIRDLLASNDAFSANIGGVGGIWQRVEDTFSVGGTANIGASSLILRVAWEPSATYQADQWPFHEIAENVFKAEWKATLDAELKKALDTAR